MPFSTTSQHFLLQGSRVFGYLAGGLLSVREGQLPHCRVRCEWHGVNACGAIHRFKDSRLSQSKFSCYFLHIVAITILLVGGRPTYTRGHNAQHNNEAQIVKVVSWKVQLAAHSREDAIRPYQQSPIYGSAIRQGDGHSVLVAVIVVTFVVTPAPETLQFAIPTDGPRADLLHNFGTELLPRDLNALLQDFLPSPPPLPSVVA
mmetsp:Transcript_159565/g.281699  ORF Transcript_159565/g.281699 Transcript_159565/m.281699 type:complete len:203 (+) Transcript_159565:714-1322(+)